MKEAKNNSGKEVERHFLALKAWNEKRAEAEKRGLDKFYKLKETFRQTNKG